MPESPKKTAPKWHHPKDVMKLHNLKVKKRALQARISNTSANHSATQVNKGFDSVFAAKKRKNPFLIDKNAKKTKPGTPPILDESTDQTLFKLLTNTTTNKTNDASFTSFNNILSKIQDEEKTTKVEEVHVVKAHGREWLPIDWSLKTKIRLLSTMPFAWNQKLKISEEASGITGFTRCLEDCNTETTLDTSPNAKFHQCCLYWQQPCLPWLSLFPRNVNSKSNNVSFATNSSVKEALHLAWSDSFRSLFQLLRTRQCPYFYVCTNNFTVLFRAAGICGYTENHAVVTPTTRGFRELLRQEEIEFTTPLKPVVSKRNSNQGSEALGQHKSEEEETAGSEPEAEEEDEESHEVWMKNMGLNADDIKQINYTQDRILHKSECEIDNSEQSLLFIQGVELNPFFNFLMNCKSIVAITGPFAGIPPTLLAPVAFRGASLNALQMRTSKVHVEDSDLYSIELVGPILPCTLHNLFLINSKEHSMTATCRNMEHTEGFSKVSVGNCENSENDKTRNCVFGLENLKDCGLNSKILKHFCDAKLENISNIECLKYSSDSKTFTWT